MQFFRDSKIDFMKASRIWLLLSAILLTGSIVILAAEKLNVGIDFAGGSQLTIKFAEKPQLDEIRAALAADGLDAVIQRFGDEDVNEVMIKLPIIEGSEEGSRGRVEAVLDRLINAGSQEFDLNSNGTEALASVLVTADPDGRRAVDEDLALRDYYRSVAAKIMEVRQEQGLIDKIDEMASLEDVSPEVLSYLKQNTFAGGFAIVQADNVGPLIGNELRRKGVLAVLASLIGMLVYIWWRFEFRFGVGALAALFHDVIICLGLYTQMGFEFNLTTVASLLTVVGYSVNDSVVVFDRVRENLRRNRREPLAEVLNVSINQTLSRTILTSGTTFLTVATLYFLGSEVIRGFAFVLMTGVVVGTYSSIFIASPIVLYWDKYFGREARAQRGAGREKRVAGSQ